MSIFSPDPAVEALREQLAIQNIRYAELQAHYHEVVDTLARLKMAGAEYMPKTKAARRFRPARPDAEEDSAAEEAKAVESRLTEDLMRDSSISRSDAEAEARRIRRAALEGAED